MSNPAKRLTGTAGRPVVTPHQATELAGDLLRALAQHAGDGEAIAGIMRHWHNVLGPSRFGVVCMATVRITFRDRLALPADAPPGALAFPLGGFVPIHDPRSSPHNKENT